MREVVKVDMKVLKMVEQSAKGSAVHWVAQLVADLADSMDSLMVVTMA